MSKNLKENLKEISIRVFIGLLAAFLILPIVTSDKVMASYFELMYGSDDGGTTKRVIKTDSTGGLLGSTTITGTVTTTGSATVSGTVSLTQASTVTAIQSGDYSIYGSATVSGTVAVSNSFALDTSVDQLESYSSSITSAVESINNKMVSGTDIGDVTINNATGAAGVYIQGQSPVAGAIAGNPVTMGQKDIIAGNTISVPTCYTAGGITYQLSLNPDLGLQFIDYTTDGSVMGVGNRLHDATDTFGPVKQGFHASEYEPDASGSPSGGESEVAVNDRVDAAANRWGQAINGVNPLYFDLDNVGFTYSTTVTQTSTGQECWNYKQATVSFVLGSTGAPTNIIFDVEASADGDNYYKLMNNGLGSWIYDDTVCALSGSGSISRGYTFPIAAQKVRVKVTATGTDANKQFEVQNPKLYLRN